MRLRGTDKKLAKLGDTIDVMIKQLEADVPGFGSSATPTVVTVTGGAGAIAYSLLFRIARYQELVI